MIDELVILTKLNDLYSGALNQIITYTIGLMAFVGILVPSLISYLQNKQFRRDHESIKLEILAELKERNEVLEKELAERVDKEFNLIKVNMLREITEKSAQVSGRVNHNQATMCQKDGFYNHATRAAIWAANDYLIGKHEGNLVKILSHLPSLLSQLDKSILEEESDIETMLNAMLEQLEKFNENGRYSNEVENIQKALRAAKKREAQQEYEAS